MNIIKAEFVGHPSEAKKRAAKIREAGGIAWLSDDYGTNMSGAREWMGVKVHYIEFADMQKHVGQVTGAQIKILKRALAEAREEAEGYRDSLMAIENDSVDPEESADVRKILRSINACAHRTLNHA